MNFNSHENHLYQCSLIESDNRAIEEEKRQRRKRQQHRQALQENLALRELRRQQQLQQQQQHLQQQPQQQQPQAVVVDMQGEETPPHNEDEAIMPPPRPQKEQGRHRALVNFDPSATTTRPRRRSCNRINFLQTFDDTKNPYKEQTSKVILDDAQKLTISDANKIILVNDNPTNLDRKRTKAKSMSSFEPTTLSKEDAEFIASTVLEVLDKKQAHKFVKQKLLQDAHISRVTQLEISTVVHINDVSLSTEDNDTTTSTEGSSFHSAPSTKSDSPVSVNIESRAVQFSPEKTVTPKKTSLPKLPSLRHQRRQLKDRFARYDQAASVTIQQLVHPVVPQPTAAAAAAVSNTTSPKKPCSVCDNSRFFLFSPETRKKLTCSCENRICNNLGVTVPQSQQLEVSQPPSQSQPQEKEVSPTTPRRQTRQRGIPKGVWDKASHMFQPFK